MCGLKWIYKDQYCYCKTNFKIEKQSLIDR